MKHSSSNRALPAKPSHEIGSTLAKSIAYHTRGSRVSSRYAVPKAAASRRSSCEVTPLTFEP